MRPLDWWLFGFALRCLVLLVGEIATLLFVVPTLFNLHRDAADAAAALVALAAIVGGAAATMVLTREIRLLFEERDHD